MGYELVVKHHGVPSIPPQQPLNGSTVDIFVKNLDAGISRDPGMIRGPLDKRSSALPLSYLAYTITRVAIIHYLYLHYTCHDSTVLHTCVCNVELACL